MRIRSLDNPSDQLSIFEDEQGDIYVTVSHSGPMAGYREFTVRIGSVHSGHEIPRLLHQKLHEVAHEFGRFKDIKYESEAARVGDREDELRWLDAQIGSTEAMLRDDPGDTLMRQSMENRLADLREQRKKLTIRNKQQ